MCEGNISFGVCIPKIECQYIMMIPWQNRCAFAQEVPDCYDDDTLFQYDIYVACNFNDFDNHAYVGLIPLFCLIVFYFVVLSCISDFFTPSLCYVSNALGLSEAVAGVTLLAFGNAAPDLITSMVGAVKMGGEQIIAQVLGDGIFLTTVVATAIAMVHPFRLCPAFLFRTLITYMAAVLLLYITYADRVVHLYEALGFILIYAIYISFFFIHSARQRNKAKSIIEKVLEEEEREANFTLVHNTPVGELRRGERGSGGADTPAPSTSSRPDPAPRRPPPSPTPVNYSKHRQHLSRRGSEALSELKEVGVEFPTRVVPRSHRTGSLTSYEAVLEVERMQALRAFGRKDEAEQTTLERSHVIAVEIHGKRVVEKSVHLLRDFVTNINPICRDEWNEDTSLGKASLVILSPIVVLCKFFVPCIDETIVCNNWCKLLFVIQCVYLPPFALWALGVHEKLQLDPEIYIPIFISVTLFGVVTSVVIAMTSKVDDPPPYHIVVAVTGFIISMICIYLIANEVVAILVAIGRTLSISMVTIFMTVLPWGNSIGDLVNAITLCKAGFPVMAYSGIFGSNLLMILVGVGFSFLVVITTNKEGLVYTMDHRYEGLLFNTYFFLGTSCVSSLFIIPTINYRIGRSYGVFLLTIYFMFCSSCFLTEFDFIYPLGPPA